MPPQTASNINNTIDNSIKHKRTVGRLAHRMGILGDNIEQHDSGQTPLVFASQIPPQTPHVTAHQCKIQGRMVRTLDANEPQHRTHPASSNHVCQCLSMRETAAQCFDATHNSTHWVLTSPQRWIGGAGIRQYYATNSVPMPCTQLSGE